MIARRILLPLLLAFISLTVVSAALEQSRDSACSEWHACGQLALAAAERGEYEAFHDLAWRAVQTGPAKDPALLYLLARAQALSGRPHDALVMLDRLTQMGVATDAAASEDFSRTRQLPGWPEVAARMETLTHASAPVHSPQAEPVAPRQKAPAIVPPPA